MPKPSKFLFDQMAVVSAANDRGDKKTAKQAFHRAYMEGSDDDRVILDRVAEQTLRDLRDK